MFSGITIPSELAITTSDLIVVEHFAQAHGETAIQAVAGGLTLAAFWGATLRDSGFHPDFNHGMYDPERNVINPWHIPSFVTEVDEKFIDRQASETSCGFTEEKTAFQIPEILHTDLQAVSGFYDLNVKKILSVSIGLRLSVLSLQQEGMEYGIAPDGEDWFWIELSRCDLLDDEGFDS